MYEWLTGLTGTAQSPQRSLCRELTRSVFPSVWMLAWLRTSWSSSRSETSSSSSGVCGNKARHSRGYKMQLSLWKASVGPQEGDYRVEISSWKSNPSYVHRRGSNSYKVQHFHTSIIIKGKHIHICIYKYCPAIQ